MIRSPVGSSEGDLDLRSLGIALRRRKRWIIWPTLVVAIAAGITVNLLPPRYKSEARILYDGRENVFLRPEAERTINQDRGPADAETLTNQVQIVLSRQLALDVIGDLKLRQNPEFDPVLGGTSILRDLLVLVGIARDRLAMSPEERVLESWYDRLTAYAVDKSRVIVIEFQSGDPLLSARIANAVADAYLRRQQIVRQDQTRGAGEWLAGEIDGLRRKVADAEAKAEEFRSRNNLFVGTNNTTLGNQQLGEFNSQVAVARSQKADSETRARIIREMLRKGEPIESSDVVNSELIRRLSEQRVTLRAQLAEQSSTLLDGHPRIKELRAQIVDLDQQIRAEAEKLIRTLENEARIAGARLEAMSSNLDALKRQAASTNEQDVQFRALEREAKAQRDLLESYLARYRETTARESIGSAPPDAKIISSAVVSNTPSFPKKLPIIAVATLITLLLCAGLVTTGELLRATAPRAAFPGSEDDETDLVRAPARVAASRLRDVEAMVAEQMRAETDSQEAEPPALSVPLATVSDIAKRLAENAEPGSRVAVFAAAADAPAALPALALARALAADGKVVMVDLTRDAPLPAGASAGSSGPGLIDVMRGTASFGQIIARDPLSRAHLVHLGGGDLADADVSIETLLPAPRFVILIEALSRTYSHVIIVAGTVKGNCARLAAIAPRCVLSVPDAAVPAVWAARQVLTAAGFSDVAIMSDAAPDLLAPQGRAA